MQGGEELQIIRRLLEAVSVIRDPHEFCQALATDVLAGQSVVSSYMVKLEGDSRLTTIASYGFSQEQLKSVWRPSLFDDMMASRAVRTGESVIYKTMSEYRAEHPAARTIDDLVGASLVCLPIRVNGSRAGALGLAFGVPLNQTLLSDFLWPVMSAACGIFFERSQEVLRAVEPTDTEKALAEFGPNSLSNRAVDILLGMANDLTNSEIAQDLSFSESTIRQESVRIYKLLGVNSRKDAVLAARSLGVLEDMS